MKKLFLAIVALVLFANVSMAQTADELKAERQQLKSEMASKDYQKMEKQYAKLGDTPQSTNLNSVDGVVNASSSILTTVLASENLLNAFKVEINEVADGEIDITKYVANLDDYVATATALGAAAIEAKTATDQIKQAKNDIKGLSPVQAVPVTKAVDWASTALQVSVKKIDINTRLLQNLINSCKAAKNL